MLPAPAPGVRVLGTGCVLLGAPPTHRALKISSGILGKGCHARRDVILPRTLNRGPSATAKKGASGF